MSAFFVASIRIHNEREYQKYLECADDVFRQFIGKYLVVDENPEVLEGKWDYSRFILIEFPDKDSLSTWYHSTEYQEILKFRLAGSECDTIVVE